MSNSLGMFLDIAKAMPRPRVLELGTKRSIPERSTFHKYWVPHAREYLGTDFEPGVDVDIVADLHRISTVTGQEQFDIIVSVATLEHVKYPHLVAHELMKILRIGGIIFILTHQTYPLHAYPYDFFRFSKEALSGLFGTKMGCRVLAEDYEYPAKILSDEVPHLVEAESYLNVRLCAEKIAPTPSRYVYELGTSSESDLADSSQVCEPHPGVHVEGRGALEWLSAMQRREQETQHNQHVLHTQLADVQRQLAAVYASRSYRITAPLRYLAKTVRMGKALMR